MRLTSYGKDVILKVFVAGIILLLISIFIGNSIVQILLVVVTIFFWLFTLYFFRDPERKIPENYTAGQIISPGDGKVVLIEEVVNKEKNFFEENEKLIQVSIFLSPLNVHVNRIPVTGVVTFLKYVKGDYVVAFDHKSSERNERTEIGIEAEATKQKVLFKQIAGFVARRIVYDLKIGDNVKAGERFGMIKFGSRVDILIKKDSKVLVKLEDTVVGGETIIAEF